MLSPPQVIDKTEEQSERLPRPRISIQSRVWRDLLDTAILVVAVYTLINLLTVRFIVDGMSMQPNFETGQFLMVSRLNYILGNPQQGDIVVLHYPQDPDVDYIKRVIGLPGDTVEIHDGEVLVNGVLLTEPYIREKCDDFHCYNHVWILEDDEYFVMGDNRNNSSDSRSFGPVSREFIVGEAVLRYWPLSEFGVVKSIGYIPTE